MKVAVCAAALLLASIVARAEETRLGAGVTLKEATSIAALVETPAAYVGKTVRIDGVATAVCQEMGCWLAVAAENDPGGDEQGNVPGVGGADPCQSCCPQCGGDA